MGLSINDSVYSSVFFFLTGLHFFHLVVGLLLLSLLSWSSSFSFRKKEDQRSGDQLLDRAGKLDSLEDCSSLQPFPWPRDVNRRQEKGKDN